MFDSACLVSLLSFLLWRQQSCRKRWRGLIIFSNRLLLAGYGARKKTSPPPSSQLSGERLSGERNQAEILFFLSTPNHPVGIDGPRRSRRRITKKKKPETTTTKTKMLQKENWKCRPWFFKKVKVFGHLVFLFSFFWSLFFYPIPLGKFKLN